MTEIDLLKPIPGLNDYFASDTGHIYTNKSGKLKMMKDQNSMGYQVICLSYLNERKTFKVHRLVLLAWLPNPNNHPFVNHKDGDKRNNKIENLEWVSKKENAIHSRDVLGNTSPLSPVCQILNGMLVKRFQSITTAEKTTGIKGISAVCLGKRRVAGGFDWMFEEDYEKGIKTPKIDFTKEVKTWKVIPEYPHDKISKDGKIYSTFFKRIKKTTDNHGYKIIGMVHKDGRHITRYVHRLVAEAYIPNPEKLPRVNHKDGNKSNNVVSNLEWCTGSENAMHAHDTGLIKSRKTVVQLNLAGDEIKRFVSLTEAAKTVGVNRNCITDACMGKQKTSAGFKWKFA